MTDQILDVDLLAFERTTGAQRRAVVDGVKRSLATGFVYTSHDLSDDLLDTTYGMLRSFFELSPDAKQQFVAPGAHGQTGYTGLLVETAASSDKPDWKEMLNWSAPIAAGHPLKRKFSTAYPDQVLPEAVVPGITEVLYRFHESIADLQRRFLRVIAEGIGCHETFFDDMVADGPTLTRAIRYPAMSELGEDGHVWAAEHGDINLITALPRATAPGLQVKVDDGWVDATPPDNAVIINTGHHARTAHQRRDPDRVASCGRRPRVRGRALQRRAVLSPAAVDDPVAGAVVLHRREPATVRGDQRRRCARRGALRDQPRRDRSPRRLTSHGRSNGADGRSSSSRCASSIQIGVARSSGAAQEAGTWGDPPAPGPYGNSGAQPQPSLG